MILNIQIWNSIQDWVFGSIYRNQKSSEICPAYYINFPNKFWLFWQHETTTRVKPKKINPRAELSTAKTKGKIN